MAAATETLSMARQDHWSFFGEKWVDGPEGELAVDSESQRWEGPAMQGHHYAFFHDSAYSDLKASFQFALTAHSDIGLIFHAKSPTDFLVLHFPDCGQASRAQHFWAALSHMDASGYMRIVKLEMIRRVPSTNRGWLDADIEITGGSLTVRIGRAGVFEVKAPEIVGTGSIGLFKFNKTRIRNVHVEGDAIRPNNGWNGAKIPACNWTHPSPETEYGLWQRPGQLVKTARGDVLLNYAVQEQPYNGKITPLMLRSSDWGINWKKPVSVEVIEGKEWEGWGAINCYPDDRLRITMSGDTGDTISESSDDGHTWSEPTELKLPPAPEGMPKVHPEPPINLKDGSVIIFGYGRHESSMEAANIYMWGSHHCQAYATRSTDCGKTWSPWVNIDGTTRTDDELAGGNLDFTEICATQMGDGSVMALIRPIYSPWMWETWSDDGGLSWTPAVRGPFPGYATPNMLRTSSGAVLVAHRLPGLTINVSWDDGITWDEGTMIDSAIWVMGGMVEVEPDVVLYVYYDSFESLMRQQRFRVTRDGLEPAVV